MIIINRCQWSNFDELLDDSEAYAEHCSNEAKWVSCEPFIGCLTCDVHKCRCAKLIPLPERAACSRVDLRPYRQRPEDIARMVSHREMPVTMMPPMMSTGMVMPPVVIFGATGPAGPVSLPKAVGPTGPTGPRKQEPQIAMTFSNGEPGTKFHIGLPAGWKFLGVLPVLEPEFMRMNERFAQDVCTILSPPDPDAPARPNGGPAPRFTLDVRWHPEGDPKGKYRCVVVTTDGLNRDDYEYHEGNPWAQPPVTEMETRSTAAVWRWLSETTSKLWDQHYRRKS